jgi:hypothetical protein
MAIKIIDKKWNEEFLKPYVAPQVNLFSNSSDSVPYSKEKMENLPASLTIAPKVKVPSSL